MPAENYTPQEQKILENATKITDTEIDLSQTNVDDELLKKLLVEKGSALQSLKLGRCSNLTEAGFMEIAKQCPNLKVLHLDECHNVTDQAVKEIAQRCPELQELDISFCRKITDEAVKAVVERCSKLEALYLDGCSNLTDEAVKAIAQRCPKLERLDLSRCKKISNEEVQKFAAERSSVEITFKKALTEEQRALMQKILEQAPYEKKASIEYLLAKNSPPAEEPSVVVALPSASASASERDPLAARTASR